MMLDMKLYSILQEALKAGGEAHYRSITEAQLELWGVKYHSLCFKQHDATYYIDDKNLNNNDFFNDNLN